MSEERVHHLVLYGATGFTGRLTAEYLASRRIPGLRWALAGRNVAKLESIRSDLAALDPACAALPLIQASADDPASLARMARDARVVITTVGPFALHGEPMVAACVDAGTDYVDITGEPHFVKSVIERHDVRARQRGIRIVNCCGFDSIPHDLGVLFTVKQLPRDVPLRVEGFVRASGTFSGGTWQSAILAFGQARSVQGSTRLRDEPSDGRKVRGLRPRLRYDRELHAWACPMPTIDPWVVLRSARALPIYGPDFGYAHYAQVRRTTTLVGGALGIGAVIALAQFGPTRRRLLAFRTSGDGPSAEVRARARFTVTLRGEGGGQKVVAKVSGGDGGYTETAKMLSESALCLAMDRERLPQTFGVITTATAMGDLLTARLQAQGIMFERVS